MKKNKNTLFTIFLCIIFFFIFYRGPKVILPSVEDLDIYIGIGCSLKKNGNIEYIFPIVLNMFKEGGDVVSKVETGRGNTIGKTREDRQKKIGKQFFLGLSKLYLVDEEYAENGIRALIDIIFKNPVINDNAFLVVCKGKSEEYFKYNIVGAENSAEYINNMIENSVNYNFFQKDYRLKSAILSMDSEGKNVVCPYVRISEDGIKMDGMAIFKKDKLGTVLNMNDTKIMNMLRENKVKGMLTIQKSSGEYINYEAKTKRTVKCSKTGDKYTFVIDLNLDGDIVNNELYMKITDKIDITKKFEKDMAIKVEEMCYGFLDKMKKQYKLDCLQLGWVAAAKYGRDTGVDWNEIVSKSDIKVNVKVHVDKLGRGQY